MSHEKSSIEPTGVANSCPQQVQPASPASCHYKQFTPCASLPLVPSSSHGFLLTAPAPRPPKI